MIIIYFIFCIIPVWLIYQFSHNYKVLLGCRAFLKYSFYFVCIFALVDAIIGRLDFDTTYQSTEEILIRNIIPLLICVLIPFIWNIWRSNFMPLFFSSSHIDNLKYFVLYLRSFDDDKRKKREDCKLMSCLYSFFCPFAIGKPNDIKSYSGSALRIFVGDDWHERVVDMMKKAPIVLFRLNNTENFFWEFEQCIKGKYLDKSLLWVADADAYGDFKDKVSDKYNLALPSENEVDDNCVLFKENDKFSIHKLEKSYSYDEFVKRYDEYRGLTSTYSDYFAGRDKNLIKAFFTWKSDPNMMQGVEKWSWTAFFIPEFYIVFQRFPNRNILYILSLLLLPLLPLRIILMIFMGRNAKKLIWLNEKWESVEYFEKMHYINCVKAILFAAIILIGIVLLFFLFRHLTTPEELAFNWGGMGA